MAINTSACWRVRPSGSNTNGGGFDCALSSAATGSNGSWATSSGTTTFTDATAAGFTSGMVNSSIRILGAGQFKVLSYVDASNITIQTPIPANSNFGSAAFWTVGSGTDYSQQNAAQLSNIGTVSTATVTLTDTGASFTSALVGNAIYVSGTGITTSWTFITAVPSGTTLTLQTSPGTTGTSVTYNIGGAWADPQTNFISTGPLNNVGGRVYVLGGGVPDPASYSYDYSLTSNGGTWANGSSTDGTFTFETDPATSSYGSGGVALIACTGAIYRFNPSTVFPRFKNLWFVATGTVQSTILTSGYAINCIFDLNGYNVSGVANGLIILGCEFFSSQAARGATTLAALIMNYRGSHAKFCNIHNNIGIGISNANGGVILEQCVVAKNGGDGIQIAGSDYMASVNNCTIDANGGHGVNVTTQAAIAKISIFNNLITNHTGGSKYGLIVGAGTAEQNTRLVPLCDYNTYYGNTTNVNSIAMGQNSTQLGSSPYVAQSTENYTLA